MTWILIFTSCLALIFLGSLGGIKLTLLRYKSLGIDHPTEIDKRLRTGMSVAAAARFPLKPTLPPNRHIREKDEAKVAAKKRRQDERR